MANSRKIPCTAIIVTLNKAVLITTNLNEAHLLLNNDDIVAIPTETVYGLAGNAYSETAIKKIFDLKKRPFYNPLIVHIKSTDYIHNVATEIPEIALKLAEKFWPGSLTLILKKHAHIPDLVTGNKDTVGIRVPNHPLTLELLGKLDFPLAAPSANPFGSISPTSATHVSNYFPTNLSVILDGGECANGLESTIIGFENDLPVLYRHGAISIEEIEEIAGTVVVKTSNDTDPSAPGMLSRHYAPSTETILSDNIAESIRFHAGKKIGLLLFNKKSNDRNVKVQEILSETGDLKEAAKNLYAAMHRLDKQHLDLIISEKLPNQGLGKSMNDRLARAIKK